MLRITRVGDHTLATNGLGRDSVVVDLGLNVGDFAMRMIDRFGCKVYGIEPVPELFEGLPSSERLISEQVAITPNGVSATLHVNAGADATIDPGLAQHTAADVTVDGTTLDDFFIRHGIDRVDLLKVDIEGAELPLFLEASDQTLKRCSQITVEFHYWIDEAQREPVRRIAERLRTLGFDRIDFTRIDTDVLFINTDTHVVTAADKLLALGVHKYAKGLGRMARRAAAR